MVLPMLGIVYYGDNHGVISPSHEMGIVVATLSGSLIGQLIFGIAAEYVWIEQTIPGLHQKKIRDQFPVYVEMSLERYPKQLY
jgi:flavin-dependent dehydrogenase